jgi:squalene-associated FAD-dependent desaturase
MNIARRQHDVVVIGAGFAGLSAACALADAGARVLVLEARSQLGGRATAFVDRETGELVDNGQHVMFGCYRSTFEFLRRVGAEGNVQRQDSLELPCYDRTGRRSVLKCPGLPAPLHLMAGVLMWEPIPWVDRMRSLRLAGPLLRARHRLHRGEILDAAADKETVRQWLARNGQGAALTSWLWEPLAVAALNQSVDHASAASFVRVLAEMFAPDPSAAAIVLPNKPLHETYALPARDFITQRGGEVRTSALARVVVENDRVIAVDVRGERVEASTVLSAVAWHSLGNLFSPGSPPVLANVLKAAAEMDAQPIVTVNLWYDREVMSETFAGLPGRTMQWVFDKRLAFGETASHLSLVSSGATELTHHSTGELTNLAAAEIREALPRAGEGRLLRATVIREKQATFSLAPGQPKRPAAMTSVRGLFLAGDWIDTGLPATIESAVQSGHTAARAILDSGIALHAGPPAARAVGI